MLKKVEASAHVKVPRALVYAVLAEYESYSEWHPDVLESRVLAAEGEIKIAEFIAPPFGTGKLILEFVESPSDWLSYHQVDRYREDGLSGRWNLQEADGGAGVVVRGSMAWKGSLFDIGRGRGLRGFLDRTLEALATRSQRLVALGGSAENGGRRRILEIVRRGRLLEVDLDGERFEMKLPRDGKST